MFKRLLRPLVLTLLATGVASAQPTPRPRGVTPTPDTTDEPVDARLSIEFNRRYQDLRSGSPLSIDWTLKWNGTRLPKGHLDVHVMQGRQLLGRLLTSRDIVLTESGTRFRTLLPPFDTSGDPFSPLDIRAYFISDDGVFPLGERSLRISDVTRRSFVVAFCQPWQQSSSPDEVNFTNSLAIEPLIRDAFGTGASMAGQRLVATYPARIYPTDVPSDPLWLCEFNVLVLLPDGLRDLRRPQLDAISGWVHAGGNLCVFLDGPLSNPIADFINALLTSRKGSRQLTRDASGIPTLVGGPVRVHRGIGRVVIHQDVPLEESFYRSQAWNKSVSFLWNRSRSTRTRLTSNPLALPNGPPARLMLKNGQQVIVPLNPTPPQAETAAPGSRPLLQSEIRWKLKTVNQLVTRLTPDDFQIVPLWLLGLLLVGYIFVIGPLDYIVLGWMGLRKLTWIVFPTMTVAFTVLIVWVSHRYMGTTGDPRHVTFRDIGENGMVVRENRYEMHLAGSHTAHTTRVRRGLFTPINHRRFLVSQQFRMPQFPVTGSTIADPAEFIGTIPSDYAAVQDLPQWSPQVNRVFRIAPEVTAPAFDWESVKPEALVGDAPRVQALRNEVEQAFGANSAALLFHGESPFSQLWNTSIPLFQQQSEWTHHPTTRGGASFPQATPALTPLSFLSDTCRRPGMGIFRAVSRISPHGGNNFEDLALMDGTDPSQWLLVIAVAEADSLVLYRKLYLDRPVTQRNPPPSPVADQAVSRLP